MKLDIIYKSNQETKSLFKSIQLASRCLDVKIRLLLRKIETSNTLYKNIIMILFLLKYSFK